MNGELRTDHIKDNLLLDVLKPLILAQQLIEQVILVTRIVDHKNGFEYLPASILIGRYIHI